MNMAVLACWRLTSDSTKSTHPKFNQRTSLIHKHIHKNILTGAGANMSLGGRNNGTSDVVRIHAQIVHLQMIEELNRTRIGSMCTIQSNLRTNERLIYSCRQPLETIHTIPSSSDSSDDISVLRFGEAGQLLSHQCSRKDSSGNRQREGISVRRDQRI
jgi:hypothetical protein